MLLDKAYVLLLWYLLIELGAPTHNIWHSQHLDVWNENMSLLRIMNSWYWMKDMYWHDLNAFSKINVLDS